ncbi:MAG: SsrA-binding protein SmpB [bacterium]|nr:SsrA-binding protein SmpB [bacterium]
MDKDKSKRLISVNKSASYEYYILEKYEAGIELKGTEVKSLRVNGANIKESYADIKNGEIYLIKCHISPYRYGNRANHDPLREKKLLLHKQEINKISTKIKEKGQTLIPLKIYLKNGIIKIEMALTKGKKLYDKRETLKKKIIEREIEKSLKIRTAK